MGVTVPVMLLARWRRLFNFSSCQGEETKVRHCRFNTKRIDYMDDLNQNCDGRTVSGGKVKGSKVKKNSKRGSRWEIFPAALWKRH